MIKAILEDSWNDEKVVLNTARISVSDRKVGDALDLRDMNLLRELMYFEHHVPFETIMLRWKISSPIFSIRQLVKHRISSISEQSKRYRGGIAEAYIPDAEATWVGDYKVLSESLRNRLVAATEYIQIEREEILQEMYDDMDKARAAGELPSALTNGKDPYRARAREIARCIQPVNERSDLYFTLNFRSLMNFLWLRNSEHAQYEIRILAQEMYNAMNAQFPELMLVTNEYFEEKNEMTKRLENRYNEARN